MLPAVVLLRVAATNVAALSSDDERVCLMCIAYKYVVVVAVVMRSWCCGVAETVLTNQLRLPLNHSTHQVDDSMAPRS